MPPQRTLRVYGQSSQSSTSPPSSSPPSSSPPSSSPNSSDSAAQGQETTLLSPGTKEWKELVQATTEKNPKNMVLQRYTDRARWIQRGMHTWVSIETVFEVGLFKSGWFEPQESQTVQREPPPGLAKMEEADINIHYQVFLDILGHLPALPNHLEYYNVYDPGALRDLIKCLEASASSGRNADTGKLRDGIVALVPEHDFDLVDPIPTHTDKTGRAFVHSTLGYLLLPIRYLAAYKKDPVRTLSNANNKKLNIVAKNWPIFLYDMSMVDYNDKWKGLLRGYLLVRVYRFVFTGPSSALTGKRKTSKKPNADIHGLKQATGGTIAYAACQTRHAISSKAIWGVKDGKFNYEEFFNLIVNLFAQEDDPWVKETLEWWNQQVFGERDDEDSDSDNPEDEETDSEEDFKAQRQERIRQAAEAAAAAAEASA
ncbi:hypothetical protein PQX77_002534 [Marasmius sp. AFHP31]|nr:hypothetical protein PQX77_002534 [Marasmius sp. AFHP31]